jgi:hypothetical protein
MSRVVARFASRVHLRRSTRLFHYEAHGVRARDGVGGREQQPIIEAARIVDAFFVEDKRMRQRADLVITAVRN